MWTVYLLSCVFAAKKMNQYEVEMMDISSKNTDAETDC